MEAWASLIVSIATLITATGAVVLGILNRTKIDENINKTNEVHVLFNSRMDQLLKANGLVQRAAGAQEERDRNNS
jgi:hypothetical protein